MKKFRGSIKYRVEIEKDYDCFAEKEIITNRYRIAEIRIISNTEKICDDLYCNFLQYAKLDSSTFQTTNYMENKNKYELVDDITISDREEFEDIKNLFKIWKKQLMEVF